MMKMMVGTQAFQNGTISISTNVSIHDLPIQLWVKMWIYIKATLVSWIIELMDGFTQYKEDKGLIPNWIFLSV